MTRKHHTKHERSQSNYRKRLENRGLHHTPRQTDVKLSDGKPSSAKR